MKAPVQLSNIERGWFLDGDRQQVENFGVI